MKSYITHSIAVIEGILIDATTRWPSLRSSFGKDLSYLRRAVERRGLPFLTVVLPTMGKVLDRGLDDGRLPIQDIPQGYPKIRKRPELYQGLFKLVFDDRNMLRDDVCIDAVAFLRQLLYCCKKLRLECNASITEETLNEFFEIERHLPHILPDTWGSENPQWSERYGHPLWGENISRRDDLLSQGGPHSGFRGNDWNSLRSLCRYVVSTIGEPDWWNISPQHGPGAVSESIKGISKYDFPNWSRRLEKEFPFDWFGSGILHDPDRPVARELPSKLHAVIKDFNGPRLICAEPLSHAWIQQGIWKWLESRMRDTFLGVSITLRDQENSRNRALSSSLDGKLATIDLSSASDRLSARLVEYVFQGSSLLDGFNACRTQYVYQDISDKHDSHLALRKFSTQGSALTMPVQSIVYFILTLWAVKLSRGTEWYLGDLKDVASEITVYGDDIIAPAHSLETIKLVLHECGLKVNTYKSYGGNGSFRESCGIQAFRGYDVTYTRILQPFDDSPSSMATTVEVSNNFFNRGYWNAAKAVSDQIPPNQAKKIRITGPDDGNFGLRSFVGSCTTHLKHGYDNALHRAYSISLVVTAKVTKKRGRGLADLSQWFTENPDPAFAWSAGWVNRIRPRKSLMRVLED